jgi:hypothetical protein
MLPAPFEWTGLSVWNYWQAIVCVFRNDRAGLGLSIEVAQTDRRRHADR